MQIFYTKYTAYKGGGAGGVGVVAPHLQTRGQTVSNPPISQAVEWCLQAQKKNIGII